MKLFRFLFALPLMLMIYILPASAQYSYELVNPPGSYYTQVFGINNAGKVLANAYDSDYSTLLASFQYDMKKGLYTTISEEFAAVEINNKGVMVGINVDGFCAIRDKDGTITTFFPPSSSGGSCYARGVNANGKVSGLEITESGVWLGFIYDSKHGTYEEFLPSEVTIANGINARGQNVGGVFLEEGEAYPGSPPGLYGYLRQPDGSVKYFEISQSSPGGTQARGISESGLISGHYLDPDTNEKKGYVTTLSQGNEFETITLTDDQVVHLSPCNPELSPPAPGYVTLTDVFAEQVRNDGVVVGMCNDYHYNPTTEHLIVYPSYGFIATPIREGE